MPQVEIHASVHRPALEFCQAPIKKNKAGSTLFNHQISVLEGGKFSIDICRSPVPKKSDAMRDYLKTEGYAAEQGIYLGNQNQSFDDRDAAMCEIEGLAVYGVDENQTTIIPQVTGIGVGIESTLKKLKSILNLPLKERPAFIGLDVDDTILGLRPDKTKEDFLKERHSLAETIAQLALEGTQIVFFSDNDSEVTLKRIGYPLEIILHEKGIDRSLMFTFYVSKMITKVKMNVFPNQKANVQNDPVYGINNRLSTQNLIVLIGILGEVIETETGIITASGLLGSYYTEKLTELAASGHYKRRTEFYPDFITQQTAWGNVAPPQIQVRDFNPQNNDASLISIGGLPSEYRLEMIHEIEDCLRSLMTHKDQINFIEEDII